VPIVELKRGNGVLLIIAKETLLGTTEGGTVRLKDSMMVSAGADI
jgi:hypothetical protein